MAHWHRASVNPAGLTKDEILEEARNPEISIKQFASRKAVMQITDMMKQWVGSDIMRWDDLTIEPYRPIRHSVRISSLRPGDPDYRAQETIYFAIECDCTEPSDVKEWWAEYARKEEANR